MDGDTDHVGCCGGRVINLGDTVNQDSIQGELGQKNESASTFLDMNVTLVRAPLKGCWRI